MKKFYFGLTLFALVSLPGCQTTGDPGKGGLFGWDEEKTKHRQEALVDEHRDKQNEIAIIRQENTYLENTQKENENSLIEIRNVLQKLKEEQDSLKNQVTQLRIDNIISEDRLRVLVERYSWLDADANRSGNQIVNIERQDIALKKMLNMEQENKSLVEEILLLIGN